MAQVTDWIAAGNSALDKGSPQEAAADFTRALDTCVQRGGSAGELLHLRVTLASAYLESGDYRGMEAVLQQAQRTAAQITDAASQAELLNAWSALHLRQGRLTDAEAELTEAQRLVINVCKPGILLPTVLHNLAALEMHSGRYVEALAHEQDAMTRLEAILPPDHPTLIRGWASMASLQYMMGRPRDAKTLMDSALASAERTFGPAHPMVAQLLLSDAVILDRLKLRKDARLARARAKKIIGTGATDERDHLTWSVRDALISDTQVHLQSK